MQLIDLWHQIPETYRDPIDIRRRKHFWKKSGVLFIHIPKTGGVSVSDALYGRPLGHFYARRIKVHAPDVFSRVYSFSVVRHPIHRAVSAFHFAKSGGGTVMKISDPKIYHTKEFNSFDSFVFDWLYKQDLNTVDGVFRPQYLYVCDGDSVIVDDVFHLEFLNEKICEIRDKTDKPIYIGHLNKTVNYQKIEVSSETAECLQHIYKKDFELFGYAI